MITDVTAEFKCMDYVRSWKLDYRPTACQFVAQLSDICWHYFQYNYTVSLITFGLVLPVQVLGSQWRQRMRREECLECPT